MIAKQYTNELVFGNKPEDIEGYEDAINSSEFYVPHHVLEWKYTKDELIAMNRYWQVNASELIWMTRHTHNKNPVLHKGNRIVSAKTRKKMSESRKGKLHSADTIKKISESNKGKHHHSEESRKKISESHKGKQHSEDTRKKMSESHKGKKRGRYNTRKKLSESHFV